MRGCRYGLRYAVAPYLYLWTSFLIQQKLVPFRIGRALGKLRALGAE